MQNITDGNSYLFVFAHPDDEVYACALMHRLIVQGKKVHAMYATSGDAGGEAERREGELREAMQHIGVKEENLHLLRIPEKQFLDSLEKIVDVGVDIARQCNPDCVVGQDYEGGHEGHDAVSFCASEIVRLVGIENHFVFPIYHGRPEERRGARFKSERTDIIPLLLSSQERSLKTQVLECHQSQQGHFDRLKLATPDYTDLLIRREVYCRIATPMNFNQKPVPDIGYEHHRNGFTFLDFLSAVGKYERTRS